MKIELYDELILTGYSYIGNVIGIEDNMVLVKNIQESSYSLYKVDYNNMKWHLVTSANIGRIYFTGYGIYKIREANFGHLNFSKNKDIFQSTIDIDVAASIISKNGNTIMQLYDGGICNYYNIKKDDCVVITNSPNGTKYSFIKNDKLKFCCYGMILEYNGDNFIIENDDDIDLNYMLVNINEKSKKDLERNFIASNDIISKFSLYKIFEDKILTFENGNSQLIDFDGNKYPLFNSKYLNYENFFNSNTLLFKDRYALVVEDGKYGIINDKGIEIIKPQFKSLTLLKGGNYIFKENDKFEISNINSNYKKQVKYDEIIELDFNIFKVKLGDLYGLIDINSNIILDIKYKEISHFKGNILMAKDFDNKTYIFNNNIKLVYMTDENNVSIDSKDGLSLIRVDSKYTILKNEYVVLKNIAARKVIIATNNVLCVDGNFVNLDKLNLKYGLRIKDGYTTYEKTFKKKEKRDTYYNMVEKEKYVNNKIKRKFKQV